MSAWQAALGAQWAARLGGCDAVVVAAWRATHVQADPRKLAALIIALLAASVFGQTRAAASSIRPRAAWALATTHLRAVLLAVAAVEAVRVAQSVLAPIRHVAVSRALARSLAAATRRSSLRSTRPARSSRQDTHICSGAGPRRGTSAPLRPSRSAHVSRTRRVSLPKYYALGIGGAYVLSRILAAVAVPFTAAVLGAWVRELPPP